MNSRRNRLPMSRVHMILLWPRCQQWNKYANAFKGKLLFCFTLYSRKQIDAWSLFFLEYWLLSHFFLKHAVIDQLSICFFSICRREVNSEKVKHGMYKPTYVMIEKPGIAHHSSKNTMVPWGNFYHLLLQHKYQFFGACWKSCVDLPWFLPGWYNLFLSLSSFIFNVIFLCFGCKSIDLEVVLSVDANPSTCKWRWW